MSFPLFEEGWGADEELLLLEGIQLYGLGNWADVAEHVATKSAELCKEHYFNIYINPSTGPLPDTSKVLTTNLEEYLRQRQDLLYYDEYPRLPTHPPGKGGKPKKNTKTKKHHNVSCPVAHKELAGFMPKRAEFETEWNNDAELMIADLQIDPNEDPAIQDLKFQVLDIYNRKLLDRYEKRKFVLQNDLLDLKKPKQKRKEEQGPDERALQRSMQLFLQLHTREEHDTFVDGLIAELHLKKRISQLQEWRRNGIRTLSEGELYELEKKRRDTEKAGGTATRAKDRNLSPFMSMAPEQRSALLRGSRWLHSHHQSLDRKSVV